MKLIAAALLTAGLSVPTQAADWWWVAGDPGDDVVVFVDGESAQRAGDVASVQALRITRAGAISTATWHGRCGTAPSSPDLAAAAHFACGTDADRMRGAAMLPGLTPSEAARAIFSSRAGGSTAKPVQAS